MKDPVIWKKVLSLRNGTDQSIDLPKDAKVISAREQFNSICIWFECDPDAEMVKRRFQLVVTGGEVGVKAGRPEFRGTCLLDDGEFVIHVYEIVSVWY